MSCLLQELPGTSYGAVSAGAPIVPQVKDERRDLFFLQLL